MSLFGRKNLSPRPEPRSGEDLELQELEPDDRTQEGVKRLSTARQRIIDGTVVLFLASLLTYLVFPHFSDFFGTREETDREIASTAPENTPPSEYSGGSSNSPAPSQDSAGSDVHQSQDRGAADPTGIPSKATTSSGRSVAETTVPPAKQSDSPALARGDQAVAGSTKPASTSSIAPRTDTAAGSPTRHSANRPTNSTGWTQTEFWKQYEDGINRQRTEPKTQPAGPPPSASTSAASKTPTQTLLAGAIAQVERMMSNGDYRAAIQKANTYRRAHPLNQHKDQRDYRELLKLQKTATEQLYKAQSPQTRSVRGISLPLDIAVIDNDLMTSYVRDDMSTWAREHFLSAEQGYMLCLTSAKSLERDGIEVTSARREIQWITESLCGLYETWAGYKRDLSFVQKAEQALRESQKFRAYSEDPGTVTTRFAELKTSLEKMRREFP